MTPQFEGPGPVEPVGPENRRGGGRGRTESLVWSVWGRTRLVYLFPGLGESSKPLVRGFSRLDRRRVARVCPRQSEALEIVRRSVKPLGRGLDPTCLGRGGPATFERRTKDGSKMAFGTIHRVSIFLYSIAWATPKFEGPIVILV